MIEHRLIERMISLIDREVRKIERDRTVNQSFVDSTVDFVRTYADRTHHGKEEEILFRDLSRKKLSENHAIIMNELIREHIAGRATTAEIVKTADAYRKGDKAALALVTRNLKKLVDFYPGHIAKEDKVFFPAVMAYFTESEQQSMLEEFREFDRKMIHSKYKSVVEYLEKS
jgi:hemerythrin-like domain-containing protein